MGKVLSCGLSRAVPAARGTQVSLACGRPESVGQAGCGVWCVCGASAVAGRGASSPEAPGWQESGGSVCRGRWVGTRGLEERSRMCDEGAWPVLGTAAMAGKDEPLRSHRGASQATPRLGSGPGHERVRPPAHVCGAKPTPEGGDIPVDKTVETTHFGYRW